MDTMDIAAAILQMIEEHLTELTYYLNKNGRPEKLYKLSEVMEALNKLKVFKANEEYLGFTLDSDGYVKTHYKLNDFTLQQEVPYDISRGYYRIEDGKLVLDKERKELIWRNN